MIAVDTNILVYSHRRDSPWFELARNTLQPLVEGSATWAIPWPCVHEFLAICSRPPSELLNALHSSATACDVSRRLEKSSDGLRNSATA